MAILDDSEEYKLRIKKLKIEFDAGRLPDTEFINSFIPRVYEKSKRFILSDREKEVIDDLFERY